MLGDLPGTVYFRKNRLTNSVRVMLTIIMEVIGINMNFFSSWILISPGKCPNQEKSPGANNNTTPTKVTAMPIKIRILPIAIVRTVKVHEWLLFRL